MTNFAVDDPGPQNVSTCLKHYLRELPEPILTYELQPEFDELLKLESITRVNAVIDLIHRLPYENFVNLKCLCGLLYNVVSKSEFNKMTAQNIGIVIGPNLIWPKDPQKQLSVSSIGSFVCEVLITEYHRIFESSTPSNDQTTHQPQT
ncbi:Rho GTPase-activating protein 92B [Thelohanellus kitauei]|uniref:Rho GTPase-activating protein 92B n=1 Tax=Thelohanellus kitauei TaxID=669202 RepID=A0A0C2MAR7_THEKT|nr:Rho GTPase-activating protein 92B [Thelohanellus kitauei]